MITGERHWERRVKSTPAHPREGCGCPACIGLDCFERPRFFAGQLLTEAELGGQMEYVLDKNRLHNRYLHGWGVVCGLEVSCHECEGFVRVHSGYAIDPCGNDIVVCSDTDVDLIKLIRECSDARARKDECDPWEPVTEVHCEDVEQHWCLSIEFDEREARPIAPLRGSSGRSCTCGSCNGNGNGNGRGKSKGSCGSCATGCDCGGRSSTCACNAATTASRGTSKLTGLVSCEPTRVREGYRFSVCELPEGCVGERSRKGLMSGTLFGQIAGCLSMIWSFMGQRVGATSWPMLGKMMVASPNEGGFDASPAKMYDSYCSLYKGMLDLYRQNPFNVRCQIPTAFEQLDCPPPGQMDGPAYLAEVQQPTWHLMTLLMQYAIDCACQAILPSCGTDPADDRVGLACITVKGDRIVRICNLSCRRYAGSFPALGWWTSIVPVLPMIAAGLARLCCRPDWVRAQSPLVNSLLEMIKSIDPDQQLVRAIAEGGLPKAVMDAVVEVPRRLDLQAAARSLAPRLAGTGLAGYRGMTEAGAHADLQAKGHAVVLREAAADEEVVATVTPTKLVASPGAEVVMTVRDGTVLDAHVEHPEVSRARAEINASRHEMSVLRSEVAIMSKELEKLRGTRVAKAKTTAKTESTAKTKRTPKTRRTTKTKRTTGKATREPPPDRGGAR